ncbi:MAG: HD domain-containing protein [Oscillospiraceae bacterium]|nr:HD domain-containing protein [Oscillospiraceae bacterium]
MEQIICNAMDFVKRVFEEEYSGHDYYHTYRVFRTATRIAEAEGAEIEIVQLGALLHDVDDVKLSPDTYKNKDKARVFLREQGVGEAEIEKICHIIDQVSFRGTDSVKPDSLEGQCVQDADRLDAIGAIGVARTFAFGGNHNRPMYDPEIPPKLNMTAEEYRKHVSPTLNHFYEKLFSLKELMTTETAKQMAEDRDRYMREFVAQFLAEWDGIK